ncbi:MAG: flagellar motor protein MotB, partial [Rhodobacteraceae bacterium]|nr:flagellar motor protein MotB [Paracoccaceae bacterium]
MAEEVLDEEQDEQECPKCPPAGAPAWMATFADMATLLMAFFVLILSFAEFNVPKFKQISGSLKEAFGVQKVVPVVEQPKGTTVIALEFSPNPSPSISETLRQDTTELQQPNLVIPEKDDIAPDGSEDDKDKDSDFEGAGGEGAEQLDATELAKQLKKAIDTGEVTVETLGENVVINFPEEKT